MELSETVARQLLDAAPDPTVAVTSDGTIVFANARVHRVFGYDPDEIIGRKVECLLPARFRDTHPGDRHRYFEQPLARPMGVGLDLYGLHKDGREFPVEISLSPIKTSEGLIVISAIRDVTSQREAERQLAEADRAKSRFLAAASHDLRQPLQALNLLNGAAFRNARGNAKLETILERQQRALDSMSSLLNSLLDISKLDAGLVVPNPVSFAIGDVFDSLASDFAGQADEGGIELVIETSDETAYTDPDLLEQLLMNLVANALRYTPEGRVVVRCRRDASRLICEVADTGPGIAAEELDRIFEEFYQIDDGTQRPEGLGLGLSIVKRLSALLGFELDVDSRPGEGSVFKVFVPAGEQIRERSAPPEYEPLTAGTRVLIIDDEPAVAHATSLLLEIEGFDVDVAGTADEAVASAARRVPDVIVSDYHLRAEQTGASVVAALREALGVAVPVVFVTGDTGRAVSQHGLEHAELLTKPLNDDALLEAIHRRVTEFANGADASGAEARPQAGSYAGSSG